MVVEHQRRMRRRILQTTAAVLPFIARVLALDWGDTTSSTTFYYPNEAEVGEIVTIAIGPKERAVVEFAGNSSDQFSVSYRQCSSDAPQPLQFQYGGILQHTTSIGGCIYVHNEESDIGIDGCTFWQYNPSETWLTDGFLHENSKLLDPGSARFENKGSSNATVDVVIYSKEITPPEGIIDHRVWIEDESVKLNRVINTSVTVYFNKEDNYCDSYTCLVTGWVNEYVEGQDSLSLCEVQETGELWYEDELFDNPITLEFDIPMDGKEYYVTLILTARESRLTSITISEMQEYGLDEAVVFQTDTTQPDSGGQQLLTSLWLAVLNMLLASAGMYAALWAGTQFPPTFGW